MQSKDNVAKAVNDYRIRYALDGTDENLSVVVHLINFLSLDRDSAIDQSSSRNNDYGIDGWHYNSEAKDLFIYQSKLSESKALSLRGINDLMNTISWLESIFIDGTLNKIPDNPSLYNLYMQLSKARSEISTITFVLLSLFNENELEDTIEAENFNVFLLKSKLYQYLKSKSGSASIKFEQYCLKAGPHRPRKKYPIKKLVDSTIILRDNAHLDLASMPFGNFLHECLISYSNSPLS